MDGSLASIFLNSAVEEPPLCADHEWSALDTQCSAELQYKLMCASMELLRAKAAAKEEEKVQEAKLHHLQELLTIIRRERDDARNECKQLRERLSQQSSSSADSPCSFMRSSPMLSSPASSPWSLQELEEHLNSDNFGVSSALELQHTLQCFSQSYNEDDADGLQALFSSDPTCESILDSSEEPFSLNMLEHGTPLSADPSLNVAKPEQSEEVTQGESESFQSARSLSRQSSSNSSSGSVQFQQTHSSMNLSDAVASLLPSVKVEGLGGGIDAPVPVPTSSTPKVLPLSVDVPVSSSMSPPPGVSNPASRSQSPHNVSPSDKQANATIVRQVHLPEPPEADPQVMLSSLPEKGSLLQAVMQAGPLLQTLLLAGPLPQWRHPPPLSTGDIPNVSMVPSNNLILPYPHASMVPGHIKYVSPSTTAASPSDRRVRAANADSCARPKKLRKLSPATPHQSQLMHMWSVEGRMPVGVVPYPPTIY